MTDNSRLQRSRTQDCRDPRLQRSHACSQWNSRKEAYASRYTLRHCDSGKDCPCALFSCVAMCLLVFTLVKHTRMTTKPQRAAHIHYQRIKISTCWDTQISSHIPQLSGVGSPDAQKRGKKKKPKPSSLMRQRQSQRARPHRLHIIRMWLMLARP